MVVDIGSSGATEYSINPLNAAISAHAPWLVKNYESVLDDIYCGNIHSHHNMESYFSATDKEALIDNAPEDGIWPSLIVSKSQKSNYAFGFSYKDQFGVSIPFTWGKEVVSVEDSVEDNRPFVEELRQFAHYGEAGGYYQQPDKSWKWEKRTRKFGDPEPPTTYPGGKTYSGGYSGTIYGQNKSNPQLAIGSANVDTVSDFDDCQDIVFKLSKIVSKAIGSTSISAFARNLAEGILLSIYTEEVIPQEGRRQLIACISNKKMVNEMMREVSKLIRQES